MDDHEKVRDLQEDAREMFGYPLCMRPDELLDFNEVIRQRKVPLRCYLAFAYRGYFQGSSEKIRYKNFITSPKLLLEFDKYLKQLRDATPLRIRRDWELLEINMKLHKNNLKKTLKDTYIDLSPLFRFVMLNTVGDSGCEEWRREAIIQLKENPYYFNHQQEQMEFYPIKKEDL